MDKQWEIIYTNKTRFSNLDGSWEDAPRGWAEWDRNGDFGVFKVCVRYNNAPYFTVVEGWDQYVLIEYPKGFRIYGVTMQTTFVDGSSPNNWIEIPCGLFLQDQIKYGRNVRDTKLFNELVQMNINGN